MAICRRCAINGNKVEGGTIGVCKIHARSKCRFYDCDAKTLGEELCTDHAHACEIARWTARAELRVEDHNGGLDTQELRAEKLAKARFLAHEAVEVFFRSLIEASQGLFGQKSTDEEERKAA